MHTYGQSREDWKQVNAPNNGDWSNPFIYSNFYYSIMYTIKSGYL